MNAEDDNRDPGRVEAARSIVAHWIKDFAIGEGPSREQFLALHEHLRPELDHELARLDRIRSAGVATNVPSSDGTEVSWDRGSSDSLSPSLLSEFQFDDSLPDRIGPYRVLETLGEGGMGIVFLAEQITPIHRRVALKIIKAGMDTRQIVARFETEREALALMNHPNVARVFDAGATEQGRPYFAMEYIAGIPITDYCDRHRLTTEERLNLFMDACHAVQHAHQKGIIHRDIKPSNVLVTVQDGKPTPKVIDFGVAKATQHRLTEKTMFTEQGQLVGTPGYMSPEQAEMTALDVDTRTDVYSLGVLLYEILVGALPFDTRELCQALLIEVQRIIREVDPPKPSTRLIALGSHSTTIAHKRRTQTRTLARELRGDVDWIVMKCLEKDRTRRYDTANALAMEIQRYLNHEPVLAGPPSAIYRIRKLIRRKRNTSLAVAAVALSLIGGLILTTFMYLRAKEAEQLQSIERERAVVAEHEAQRLAIEASQSLDLANQRLGEILQFVQLLSSSGASNWVPPDSVMVRPWKAIVIHHSATRTGSIDGFNKAHRTAGWDEIGYHFVIANDPSSADGLVAPTSRWLSQKHGAHSKTEDNYYNNFGIGICVVGDFTRTSPTEGQLNALLALTRWLMRVYDIPSESVVLHKEVTGKTRCPGDHFPSERFRELIQKPDLTVRDPEL